MVAGYDPLHDEGIAYADKLMAAGTPASLVDYPTLAHGFITMSGVLDAARLAVSQVADAFRAAAGG
jgi:acetyl esterase